MFRSSRTGETGSRNQGIRRVPTVRVVFDQFDRRHHTAPTRCRLQQRRGSGRPTMATAPKRISQARPSTDRQVWRQRFHSGMRKSRNTIASNRPTWTMRSERGYLHRRRRSYCTTFGDLEATSFETSCGSTGVPRRAELSGRDRGIRATAVRWCLRNPRRYAGTASGADPEHDPETLRADQQPQQAHRLLCARPFVEEQFSGGRCAVRIHEAGYEIPRGENRVAGRSGDRFLINLVCADAG